MKSPCHSVQGGSKILITGPFHAPASYSAIFDGIETPALWVQLGVLRCFCPRKTIFRVILEHFSKAVIFDPLAHSAGRVSLQIACDGVLMSRPASFEYKEISYLEAGDRESRSPKNWTSTLFCWLVARLEYLSSQLDIQGSGIDKSFSSLVTFDVN
jgi:hypothetical protein